MMCYLQWQVGVTSLLKALPKLPPCMQSMPPRKDLFLGLCVFLNSVRAPKPKEEVTHIKSDLVCHLPRRWGGELSPTNLLKDLKLNLLQPEIGLLPGTLAYPTRPYPLDHLPGTTQPLGQVICFRRLLLLGTLVNQVPSLSSTSVFSSIKCQATMRGRLQKTMSSAGRGHTLSWNVARRSFKTHPAILLIARDTKQPCGQGQPPDTASSYPH